MGGKKVYRYERESQGYVDRKARKATPLLDSVGQPFRLERRLHQYFPSDNNIGLF